MQQHPKLHIHLRINNSDSVINDIKHNRVDIGIVEKDIQDNAIECKTIIEDEMVYIYKNQLNLEWISASLEKKDQERDFIKRQDFPN